MCLFKIQCAFLNFHERGLWSQLNTELGIRIKCSVLVQVYLEHNIEASDLCLHLVFKTLLIVIPRVFMLLFLCI